jgi:hypothetical protein
MDEILRMRASVVTTEALANLRGLAKELGLTGRAANAVNTVTARREVSQLQATFSSVSREIRNQVVPALSSFGFVGGGVGVMLAGMASATKDYAGKVRDLSMQTRTLEMSAKDIRTYNLAAEQFGITADQMGAALQNLKTNFYDFKRNLNVDGVADQLRQMGQGDLLNAIKAAKDMAEVTGLVTQRMEWLNKVDPERARRLAEALYGLGQAAHITTTAVEEAAKRTADLTENQKKLADEFNRSFSGMSAAWKRFSESGLESAQPKIAWLMEKSTALLELFERIGRTPGSSPGEVTPLPGYDREGWGRTEGEFGKRTVPRLRDGYKPMSFGGDDGTGGMRELLREGVFEGLTKFYQTQTGGASGGSGFMPAAYSGGGGGGAAFPGNASYPRMGGDSGAARALSGGGGATTAGGNTRGDRNNNPGNLKFGPLAQAFGATGADDRGFAIFPNRLSGEEAQSALVKSDRYKGLTLDQFGNKYAEGSADWKRTVGGALGIGAGDIVNNQDPRLLGAIRRAEGTGRGGGMDAMAPAGAGLERDTTVISSPSGARFRVAREFAPNFQRFIDSYEREGGVIGKNSGGLSSRPGNASYHPMGRAIDVNQIGYGVRGGGKVLPQEVEERLAEEAGLYPGSKFRSRSDAGHFEVRNRALALEKQQLWQQGGQPALTATGKVEINVHGQAKATAKTSGDLFQETKITNYKQMEQASPGGGGHPDGGF